MIFILLFIQENEDLGKMISELLYIQENEDLGKMISSGRLAKLEGELALQKNLSEQMKQNQLEVF